jgi:predicted ATPase/DNA-binding winged helix-turn-helix (wHTH) protein
MEPSASANRSISFGSFRLFPAQRLLLDSGNPLRLGSRALDILIALVESAGELVGKTELMARVWPDTIVVEDNLTVHVAALRRALSDGIGGNRYLITIPGRGYCFVAPVTEEDVEQWPSPPASARYAHNLPGFLTRLIGRRGTMSRLIEQSPAQRLLTIAGPGGIGKTSVALAVAEELVPKFEHGVWMVDLAPVRDPRYVPSALSAALGLQGPSGDPMPGLLGVLNDKNMLLLIDNCEHLIEAAADLAVSVLRHAPGVRILATSREPLRVEGEQVHRLSGLESPPPSALLTAAEALAFPAVQLFVERGAASMGEFELDDADAPLVAEICRKLDGVPLAIEFAASRIDALGVRGIAARLEEGLSALTGGRRAALPRQHTMRATLDWSYGLLSEREQAVLRRLSIFAGSFTLRAAAAVAADAVLPEGEIVDQVLELVAKSLIMADVRGADPRLRLLETTRAYARMKLAESGEADAVGRRHAEYYRSVPETAGFDQLKLPAEPTALPSSDMPRSSTRPPRSRSRNQLLAPALNNSGEGLAPAIAEGKAIFVRTYRVGRV